jgi:hypothetical protein
MQKVQYDQTLCPERTKKARIVKKITLVSLEAHVLMLGSKSPKLYSASIAEIGKTHALEQAFRKYAHALNIEKIRFNL